MPESESSAPQSATLLLRLLGLQLERELGSLLRELTPSLTVAQYATLTYIRDHAEANGAELARLNSVTAQTMTTMLGNLSARALIQRSRGPEGSGASLRTKLTGRGEKLLREAEALANTFEHGLLPGMKQAVAEGGDSLPAILGAFRSAVATSQLDGNPAPAGA